MKAVTDIKTLIFTCGDVNGIGPEITLKTINKLFNPAKRRIIFLCPVKVFEKAASLISLKFPFQFIVSSESIQDSGHTVYIYDFEKVKQDIGRATKHSGICAAHSIELSYALCTKLKDSAIITSPISKNAFELAGVKYPGQTEYYADLSNSKKYSMVFLSRKMICALATIHEPIMKVSGLLSKEKIKRSIEILASTLKEDIGIKNPTIGVLGLNPHAGEEGRIGIEESTIISPAIKELKQKQIAGPFVPDAYFATKRYLEYDATLGMYHDQVLIPFKMLCFDKGVNYTAGLPVIRTSPDHGTAYDIAELGMANPQSMIESVYWAEKIITNRHKINGF
jgi:4-hydroxythreonine-4-phosphate dehydrogenase